MGNDRTDHHSGVASLVDVVGMGTNYYTKVNECNECGRHDDIHLGKSSAGWQFVFQYNGGQYYKDTEEMREWMKGKIICDEYGRNVSGDQFWKFVESKQSDTQGGGDATIINGYTFYDSEFS